MKVGDKVLISPDLTRLAEWIPAKVIEVENNPFVGVVISCLLYTSPSPRDTR